MLFIKRAFLLLQVVIGVSSLLLFTSFKSNSPYQIEKKIFIPQSQLEKSRYFYVPFEVPKGASRISVSYDYNTLGGTNVVDIGVFDSRFSGTDTDSNGFRGWSGGKRSEFFIAKDDSTPGYISSEIPNGTWRVILGLYKVAPQGVEVNLKISFSNSAEIRLIAETPIEAPLRDPMLEFGRNAQKSQWFKGDLHLHTLHSDGDWALPNLLETAMGNGLDFVGITEHNTPTHHFEIDRIAKNYAPMLVMRGEEVTTYGGHFNVWGLPSGEWIDFRVRAGESQNIARLVEKTHKLGALASINHPFAPCYGCDWSYDYEKTGFDSIEVWNGAWDVTDESALKKWDELLQQGKQLTAIGSSDFHRPPALIGLPTTHVGAKSLNQKEILAAVKNGKVFVSEKPEQSLEFSAYNTKTRSYIGETSVKLKENLIRLNAKAKGFPVGSSVSLISNGKVLLKEAIGGEVYQFAKGFNMAGDLYFRLEIRDANGKMLAFTNPIYTRNK